MYVSVFFFSPPIILPPELIPHSSQVQTNHMAQRPYPNDREENGVQHSFQQFVARAQQLYTQMQEPDLLPDEECNASKQFLQFTLTGRMDFNDMPCHATLNACQDLYNPGRYHTGSGVIIITIT